MLEIRTLNCYASIRIIHVYYASIYVYIMKVYVSIYEYTMSVYMSKIVVSCLCLHGFIEDVMMAS